MEKNSCATMIESRRFDEVIFFQDNNIWAFKRFSQGNQIQLNDMTTKQFEYLECY